MTSTICVIQARRQSSRLPDKVLLPLAGKPVLQHVIERCQRIPGVCAVIVASPEGKEEAMLAKVAKSCGADSHIGSLVDVLARYWGAVRDRECDYVMRVTADCPLIDPYVCEKLIDKIKCDQADYCGLGNGWPHGLDCEVFTRSLLKKTYQMASSSLDREHVTLWMKRQDNIKRSSLEFGQDSLREGNRWVVDYAEDYEFMCALFELLPKGEHFPDWQTIAEAVNKNPYLRDINGSCEKEWAEKSRNIFKEASSQEGDVP